MFRPLALTLLAALTLPAQSDFDAASAARFARLALDCVHREYPNKIAHVMNADADAQPPRSLTPAFYGCFDWHSAVHAHWLLARLARTYPQASFAAAARAALDASLTPGNLAREAAYLAASGREGFERPYGLAWLLQLAAELREWHDPDATRWSAALAPLERAAVARVRTWLPKLSHPVRAGEHSETAFALGLMLDYARISGNAGFLHLIEQRVRDYYLPDRACPVRWEPSGEDFLSPCLAEADLVRRVLPHPEFATWFDAFLPDLSLTPARVTDPSDGKLAHLDGLNLSRAWMLAGIAASLGATHPRHAAIERLAAEHRAAGLRAVTGEHYAGGHWLGSFAAYLVTGRGLPPQPAPAERVDFGYAFAPPHRITIARPSASEKTLLDLEPGSLTASWSYDDLRQMPLAIFKTPRTSWHVRLRPLRDGKPFAQSSWTRGERFLPMLDNLYQDSSGSVRLEAIGAASGALVRVTVRNADSHPHRFAVQSEVRSGWVAHNPAWIEPGLDPDALLACQNERADRVLMLGVGAAAFPVERMAMNLEWTLAPGETRTGWIVRPYAAYQKDLPALRARNWNREFTAALAEWHALLGRAARVEIPDPAVQNAFYAGLADLFIMREPLAKGYVGGVAGTEGYRANNPFEPCMAAIALDQLGLHAEAADGLRVHIDMQEPDGNWTDPKGWAHHMWGTASLKAWPIMEHYRLTGDRAYLAAAYPHLAASSRWQETMRRKTRVLQDGVRPATYGLMPRGMGDGGLMSGTDYFGVFYPHNILAVFADKLSVEAAQILGREADLPELRRIYQTALADLLASLDRGAIAEDGFRWIPGSPNDPAGSRWGALYTIFPAGILAPDHPLVTGTIRKIEQNISPGGQPLRTGWMLDGAWVAITLDNLAEAHLVRGDADRAVAYLYSTLNHGTPLYSWCEERGPEPGAKKTSGDRQHLWTPLAVVRFLRDSLVMEQGDSLHLALATARTWLVQGRVVGVRGASTHFGDVSYRIESDVDHGLIRARVDLPTRRAPREIVLHLRHPDRAPIRSLTVNGRPAAFTGESLRLPASAGPLRIEARY
jgi:hypothetical protein